MTEWAWRKAEATPLGGGGGLLQRHRVAPQRPRCSGGPLMKSDRHRGVPGGGHESPAAEHSPAGAGHLHTVRHVVFRLGRDRYALPLSAIRRVEVAPARYTRVLAGAGPGAGW